MANSANQMAITAEMRQQFLEAWIIGLPDLVQVVDSAARLLASHVAEPPIMMRRRDVVDDLRRLSNEWLTCIMTTLSQAEPAGVLTTRMPGLGGELSLVDHGTIENEILASRLALAIMENASAEFSDLRSRVFSLEGIEKLNAHDILRPNVLARVIVNAWSVAGLSNDGWNTLQAVLHHEFSTFALDAYHEANRWLLDRGVRPEIDLRPLVRRTPDAARYQAAALAKTDLMTGRHQLSRYAAAAAPASSCESGEALLGRLNRLVGKQLPEFGSTNAPALSPQLSEAITGIQQHLVDCAPVTSKLRGEVPAQPALLADLQQRKQALKSAAGTQAERATIEIVALLFQRILTEERIPAVVRVWFARLQMPVLRVAVGEPDFFAAADHPARRLIDRMGASVMGFDVSGQPLGEALEKEIKRVVQVVEAYPDTGRRVFQTVLTEFERFLENYFKNENEASCKGISLAQQVEQRETLAIQYTIELRKMLNEVPVQVGVREFLFHVWADVLATAAVKSGAQGQDTKLMRRAAADLIWSASAKVSRDDRAEVIRRLPGLLKSLRDGMQQAGIAESKQDEHIHSLNNSLAAAFTAKAAAIPQDRLKDLMKNLETLEDLLPDAADVEIDESMVLDLSGYESSELEVVAEGGSMPTASMVAWARELQVGSWLMLDYRGRTEVVQLAWQGLRRQLSLFVSPQGRGILFQQRRLAAFLQAGLLVPAQEESLTTRATRSVLAKLDADPSKLFG